MTEISVEIQKELEKRDKKVNTLLSSQQYKILRRKKSKIAVQAFESRLRREIRERTDSTFISDLWVEYRLKGLKPIQIDDDYDLTHIFR